jgi:RHS repeat-associated protein
MAASLAQAQSCTLYEADTGLAAETPWQATAQEAANVLIAMCNSGVPANLGCFGGYSHTPEYSGCDEQTPGVTCTAEMPADVPTPNYGFPLTIPLSVLVSTPTGSTMQQTTMHLGANVWSHCPNYFVQAPSIAPAAADEGRPCPVCMNAPDPVNPSSGNEALVEPDIEPVGWRGRLAFKRYYNSLDTSATDMGPGWRPSFSRYLKVKTITLGTSTVSSSYSTPSDACTSGWLQIRSSVVGLQTASASYSNGACTVSNGAEVMELQISSTPWGTTGNNFPEVLAYRDDGHAISFLSNGQTFTAEPGTGYQLLPNGSNYELIDDDGNAETYNSSGKLLWIADRDGNLESANHNASTGLLTSVVDTFGHALAFAYDSQNRLQTVTAPDGSSVQYAYNSTGQLSQVTNPDLSTRQFLYADPSWPTGLTGVVDESGNTEFTLSYDSQGRVVSSTIGGASSSMNFTYNSDSDTTETDPLGAVRTFASMQVGNHEFSSSVSGAPCYSCGYVAATTYDGGGFPANETDFNGNVTAHAYDDTRGLENSRTEASGTSVARTITTQWDPAYGLPTLISVYAGGIASGTPLRTTFFSYDGTGNLLTKTIADPASGTSRTWTYTYDNYGRVLTSDGPRTDVSDLTTYTYYTCTTGSQCGELETVSDALGHVTTYSTYDANGRPLTITDPNGVVTTLTYDARGRLKSRTVGSESTSFAYYPTELLEQVTLPDGSSLSYTYDAAHRLTQVTDGLGSKIVYSLDAMGNRTAENSYDASGTLHRTHTRVINTLNEVYQEVNAAGTAAVTTTFGYDNEGNPTSIDAPLSRNAAESYDALNRVSSITDPGTGVTTFGYDAEDDLTSVKDPRNLTTSYGYDGLGDLTSQMSPDTGTTTNTYDSGGNLATATDARGAVATHGYDPLNRVTSIVYSLSGTTDQTLSFTYDQGTDGVGHLTGVSDVNHSMSFSYDGLGEMTGVSQTVSGVTRSITYGYTAGNLTTMTTPSGQTITYGYNVDHQVTSITVNGTTVLSNVSYEPFGPVDGWTWGNGATSSRSFSEDGLITGISSPGSQESLGYDNASRISGITSTASGSSNWTYGYDPLDRLTSATSSSATEGWTYDADGNRLTDTGTAPSTYSISSTSNEISGITGSPSRIYTYDAAGNALGDSTDTDTYNDAGRLKSVTNSSGTTAFIYNALGQMIESSGPSSSVLYVHDQAGHLLGEYDGSGNLVQETVWLGDIPVATLRPNGSSVATYYVENDQLDTPRAIIRPSDNAQMWSWFSGPFGSDSPNTNPQGAGTFTYDLRFPGQIAGSWGNTLQNFHRDYDPAVGRYVESDPIGLKGGLNTYSYARENPEYWIDPPGLASCPGGEWSLEIGGASGTLAFGGYVSKGRATYVCKTNPPVKCSASTICIGGGAIVGAGFGWDLYGYLVGASDSSDLAGWSGWQAAGSIGPVGVQAPPGGGISTNVGPSVGAGIAAVKCYTYALICASGHCGRSN